MIRGDDQTFVATVTLAGSPVNLALTTMVFNARWNQDDRTAVISLSTTTGGIVVPNPSIGVANIIIPSAMTEALPSPEAKLQWNCTLKDSTGLIHTLDSGILTITASST